MNDFRNMEEKEKGEGFAITCGSCGSTSIVPRSHKRYCPVCGPDVATPITVTAVKAENPGSLHMVEVTYEMILRRSVELLVGDREYGLLCNGDCSPVEPDMDREMASASAGDYETDYAMKDLDTGMQVVDWR